MAFIIPAIESTANKEKPAAYKLENNVGHSCLTGIMFNPEDTPTEVFTTGVLYIGGFTIYKAFDYAIYVNGKNSFVVKDCAIKDSRIGVFSHIFGPSATSHLRADKSILIKDSSFVG